LVSSGQGSPITLQSRSPMAIQLRRIISAVPANLQYIRNEFYIYENTQVVLLVQMCNVRRAMPMLIYISVKTNQKDWTPR
jgi:hypothetical protein